MSYVPIPFTFLQIVDAQKTSDGVGQSPYIAYLIRCGVSTHTQWDCIALSF